MSVDVWTTAVGAGLAIFAAAANQIVGHVVESKREGKAHQRTIRQERLSAGASLIEHIIRWRMHGTAEFREDEELDRHQVCGNLRRFQSDSAGVRAHLLTVCSDHLVNWLNVSLEAEELYLEDVLRGGASDREADQRLGHFLAFLDALCQEIRNDVTTWEGGTTSRKDFPFFD